MEDKILLDENKQYSFDFTNTKYVLELHDIANKLKLNDVDFITELENEIIFLEYKNANIKGAVNPNAMFEKIKTEEFYKSISKKYYDSLIIFWASGGNSSEKELPITYVLLIEHPLIDKKIRRQLKLKIGKRLPLGIEDNLIVREFLSRFEVYSLDEWNMVYNNIKISPVEYAETV